MASRGCLGLGAVLSPLHAGDVLHFEVFGATDALLAEDFQFIGDTVASPAAVAAMEAAGEAHAVGIGHPRSEVCAASPTVNSWASVFAFADGVGERRVYSRAHPSTGVIGKAAEARRECNDLLTILSLQISVLEPKV